MTTSKADLTFASIPYAVLPAFQKPVYDAIRTEDAAFYSGLTDSGFMLDFEDDDTGLFMKYLRRGSGYYIDVGASQLIIDGKIKLKSGSDVSHLTETSVVLQDGTEAIEQRLPRNANLFSAQHTSVQEQNQQAGHDQRSTSPDTCARNIFLGRV